jgi:hypothetical protein
MCDIMNCPEPLASPRFVLEYILPVLELHVTIWLDKSHRMNNIGMLITTWICRVVARKKKISGLVHPNRLAVVPHKTVAEISKIKNIGLVSGCDAGMAERIH